MGKVNLIYWDSDNFGDALSPLLVEEYLGLKPQHKLSPLSTYNVRLLIKSLMKLELYRLKSILLPWQRSLLCVGSVMSWGKKNSIIWGAGFMNKSDSFKGGKTYAVRGKLTHEKLRKEGFRGCSVYGDPALLLPLWIKPNKAKKHKLGLVPHWHEVDFFLEHYGNRYHVVDLRSRDVRKVVSQIASCEHILSTSLHGVIVAHAYEVPALWIRQGNIDTDGFKFHDYFSSVDIPLYDGFKNIGEILDKEENWTALFNQNRDKSRINNSLDQIQVDLLRSAPFPLRERYKYKIQ